MPRHARIDAPGALHHIIVRGIERSNIFRDDIDRENFLERLGDLVMQTRTICYAWALIPNHFHLLLKTGNVPIATLMRRLLTGHAAGFNRRHRRSGHVFQNRYKSILCQEDVYLKELVRYIHLNPLRAGLVKDLDELDNFRFAGHGAIMGKNPNEWQSIDQTLAFFGEEAFRARLNYREFMCKGVGQGYRPELIGGGLIRSAGGWTEVRAMRKTGNLNKGDERILGSADFVETVLADAKESMQRGYAWKAKGVSLDHLILIVSDLMTLHPQELIGPTKARNIVKARKLICYWAVRELGFSMT
ncbi:MAG: transposase, partial [Lentisphaerae bacterium]|nr:transposase [Lentisphaerota bacterium]